MTEQTELEAYNFSHWPGVVDRSSQFRQALPVGAQAPGFSATLLETGQAVQLSDYWRESDLLVEFGSIT